MAQQLPSEAEFLATLNRVRRGDDLAARPRPALDARLRAEHLDAAAEGRKPDSYKQALEWHGFAFTPPEKLRPMSNGEAHKEGLWWNLRLRMAFTETDLTTTFRGPEDLDKFLRGQKLLRRGIAARIR
jgi:hypothetical protein